MDGDVRAILGRARVLLEPDGAWCQGAEARDATGRPTYYVAGVSWCATGAVRQAARQLLGGAPTHDEYVKALDACNVLAFGLGTPTSAGVQGWNDTLGRTQAEVLELFDFVLADVPECA
jgi:hypothetical protein